MSELIATFFSGSYLEILAQILGIFAFATSVLSFQMKTYRSIMIVQSICAALFTIHLGLMFLSGHADALAGCAGNGICLVRDLIFLFLGEREERRPWLKAVIFSIIMVISGIFTWSSPVSLLCMIGLILNTVSFSIKDPQKVRRTILFAAPLFFVYELLNASIGGSINEVVSFTSAVVGLIRFRSKKPTQKEQQTV